jgi:arylformamidase
MTRRGPVDISRPVTESTPVYPGDPAPWFDTEVTDGVTLTILHLPLHAGSHADAPLHVLPSGAAAETVPLDALCGPCCVVEAGPGPIDEARVRGWPLRDRDRVLVRPGPSGCVFTPGGARALVERRVRLLGVGDFGPDAVGDPSLPAHRVLLSAGVVLLENLRLDDATPGRWRLTCLGLHLPGREAFPVRAVLS